MRLSAAKTTLKFGADNVARLRRYSATRDGNPIDVTDLSDDLHQFVLGTTRLEITCEVFGNLPLAVGQSGTIVITPGGDAANAIDFGSQEFYVTEASPSGEVDGATTMSVRFQPKKAGDT